MPAVKYWKVDLFADTGFTVPTSVMTGPAREAIPQRPFFTGYSLIRPHLSIADDQFIELLVSVDCVEVFRVRRSLIGSLRITPVYPEAPADVAEPVPSVATDDV